MSSQEIPFAKMEREMSRTEVWTCSFTSLIIGRGIFPFLLRKDPGFSFLDQKLIRYPFSFQN
jgi:hypothetical protein